MTEPETKARLRPESATERHAVIQEARTWLGTPYHHHGRVKGVGVDCAQLPGLVYSAVGLIKYRDPGNYPPDWHLHRDVERYLNEVFTYGILTKTPKMADFVVYKFGRTFAHGGIVVRWPTEIIHAYKDDGVTLARGDSGVLKDREHIFFTIWGD